MPTWTWLYKMAWTIDTLQLI